MTFPAERGGKIVPGHAWGWQAPGEEGEEVSAELKLQTAWTTGRVRFDSLLAEEQDGGK